MRTGIGLGSNLGDRLTNLRVARKSVAAIPNVNGPILSSPVYETDPIDCEVGAAKFFNAVIEVDYEGEPNELLERLIQIEESLGRNRDHARNVSRLIDLDLLYFGERKIESSELQLPHPRLQQRRFVLQPLADIRPDLIFPDQAEPVRELLARLSDSSKVRRSSEQW